MVSFSDYTVKMRTGLFTGSMQNTAGGSILNRDETYYSICGLFADNYSMGTSIVDNVLPDCGQNTISYIAIFHNGSNSPYINEIDFGARAALWSIGDALTKQETTIYNECTELLLTAMGIRL